MAASKHGQKCRVCVRVAERQDEKPIGGDLWSWDGNHTTQALGAADSGRRRRKGI